MKLKVCGMRNVENINALLALKPDFIGFIFYKKSSRDVGVFPTVTIPSSIKKVGVFVNESVENVLKIVAKNSLDCVQLHGDESSEYCKDLKKMSTANLEIIKAFAVDVTFDFMQTAVYEDVVDCFLFDTKGEKAGGNGIAFDWSLLAQNTSEKPFLLSGGLGLDSIPELSLFFKSPLAKNCIGLDVNSKFEISPALKNIEKIKEFKEQLV